MKETVSGVATINNLLAKLTSLGIADQVTFATLNVFGTWAPPASTPRPATRRMAAISR